MTYAFQLFREGTAVKTEKQTEVDAVQFVWRGQGEWFGDVIAHRIGWCNPDLALESHSEDGKIRYSYYLYRYEEKDGGKVEFMYEVPYTSRQYRPDNDDSERDYLLEEYLEDEEQAYLENQQYDTEKEEQSRPDADEDYVDEHDERDWVQV